MSKSSTILGSDTAFELEKAKRALEVAKNSLEVAKQNYEEIMTRAETAGISKAKLKKRVDERVSALFENGFGEGDLGGPAKSASRVDRSKRLKKSETGTHQETSSGEGLAAEFDSEEAPERELSLEP